MKTLKQLQHAFSHALIKGDIKPALKQCIVATDALNEQQRLNIYKNSFRENMTNALKNTFPVCYKLVGEDFFRGLAAQYIIAVPSQSPNLNHYGKQFAEYVETFAPAQSLPYLPDVIRLEWAWHCVLQAKTNPPFDFIALAQVCEKDQERVKLHLNSAGCLFYSPYPVHRIWQVNQDDYFGDQTVNLDEGSVKLIIWRDAENTMHMDALSDEYWQLLTAINEGKTLGNICQYCNDAEQASSLLNLLPELVQRNWIGGFTLGID